jgi:hypothetical protein
MDEVKFINCEQYVLARMFKLEQENEALKAKVADHEATIRANNERHDELMSLLKKGFKVKVACNGTDRYVDFSSVWETYDGTEFDQLVALLELEVPEIENTTTEEEN